MASCSMTLEHWSTDISYPQKTLPPWKTIPCEILALVEVCAFEYSLIIVSLNYRHCSSQSEQRLLLAVLQLTGTQQTHSKRYVTSRHVIPRRSLRPRLLLTWTATLIVATSPFVWFHLVSGASSTADVATISVDTQSKFRKLVLCVFVLSFAMPAAGLLIVYLLLLRTWTTATRTDRYLVIFGLFKNF